ncbi:hypothetical protein B0I35DRAFT_243457 [Stachybotrys elegans]|uniref:Uncharacterized protein n=1 Tax=Stachybotrys elegans TaxID=80388 RepID=A0A8K0SP47_9HYPO|nr:hypothetical protein B0I35DRAFT_243457 [Stachybotrys elegans]
MERAQHLAAGDTAWLLTMFSCSPLCVHARIIHHSSRVWTNAPPPLAGSCKNSNVVVFSRTLSTSGSTRPELMIHSIVLETGFLDQESRGCVGRPWAYSLGAATGPSLSFPARSGREEKDRVCRATDLVLQTKTVTIVPVFLLVWSYYGLPSCSMDDDMLLSGSWPDLL